MGPIATHGYPLMPFETNGGVQDCVPEHCTALEKSGVAIIITFTFIYKITNRKYYMVSGAKHYFESPQHGYENITELTKTYYII